MSEILLNDWNDVLSEEFEKPYYKALKHFIVDKTSLKRYFRVQQIFLMHSIKQRYPM